MRAITLAALMACSAPPATYSGGGRGCPDTPDGRQQFMNNDGGCSTEAVNQYQRLEPIDRSRQSIQSDAELESITVAATAQGATAWLLIVRNDSDTALSILWDESSFVTSNGDSQGRLIRGDTRQADVARAQLPTPIPPRATVREVVLVEKMISFELNDAKLGRDPLPTAQHAEWTKLRARVRAAIVGGRMNLKFSDGRRWSGTVVDVTGASRERDHAAASAGRS